MSEALSTSPASAPRPLPTWEATIAPLALPSIAMRGPASCLISSGIAWPRAWVAEPAIGSTSTFQTSIVSTIHSARDHAAVVVTPEGNSVVVSSQWSARRTASATAPDWAGLTRRVGLLGRGPAGEVGDRLPVDRAVVRREEATASAPSAR